MFGDSPGPVSHRQIHRRSAAYARETTVALPEEQTLIARCLAAEDGAWDEFVDRYIHLITHVVNSCLKVRGTQSQHFRDDLVAEVMLGIVDKDFRVLRRFRGQSTLATYLVVVARRIAMRSISRQIVTARPVQRMSVDAAHVAPGTDVALDVENKEELAALLEKLPSDQATAVRMYHLEHQNYGAIGKSIGISENSVGPLLSRARARLKELG